MNELIKIDESGKTTAKELYEFLELDTKNYSRWVKTNIEENEFYQENSDWWGFVIVKSGNETKDFTLTTDFAKHLCMLSRSERGKQARSYFVEVEKQIHKPQHNLPTSFADALRLLATTVEEKELLQLENAQSKQIINELQPKATYYDMILQCKDLLAITTIAKDYGMSGKSLNALLHELEVQYKMRKTWLLYQNYADKGYTQSKTHVINAERSEMNTYWTQKGRLFIYDLLKSKKGILPLIERDQQAVS